MTALDDARAALAKLNERTNTIRIGKAFAREADLDVLAMWKAAASLRVLIAELDGKPALPDGDEREALARLVRYETGEAEEESGFLADAILAAGFRRPGPITDAQVEASAIASARADNADYWVDEIAEWEGSEEWEREAWPENYPATAYEDRENYRKIARAALGAAREAS